MSSDLKNSLKKALESNTKKECQEFQVACYDELFSSIFRTTLYFSVSDAEDLTHDIFIKIFSIDLQSLDKHAGYLDKYFLKLARNHCLNFVNRKRKTFNPLDNIMIEDVGVGFGQVIEIESMLDDLPNRNALAIKMRIEGYGNQEIAKEMGITEGAVKNLVYRGRNMIRKKYDTEEIKFYRKPKDQCDE